VRDVELADVTPDGADHAEIHARAPPLNLKPQSWEILVLTSSIIWAPLQASSFWQSRYDVPANLSSVSV
jgi:hypothetical protein